VPQPTRIENFSVIDLRQGSPFYANARQRPLAQLHAESIAAIFDWQMYELCIRALGGRVASRSESNGMRGWLICSLMLGVATSAQAHHSFAMFDVTRVETVQGTVKTLEWASPHVWLWVLVADGKGGVQTFGFETVSPGQLERDYGWNRRIVNPGDKVVIEYAPLKSGNTGGELEKVTLADGRILATRFTKAKESAADPGPDEHKK